ncbi:hypothetical protein OQA88_2603 [Cercophora sp. LCS_1]
MLVKEWVQKLGPKIGTISNFLGQTPIHGALAPESSNILSLLLCYIPALIDLADKWGLTPLIYAVALGYDQAASLLIKNGASLTLHSRWQHFDFIGCAFQWDREHLLWGLLPDVETSPEGPGGYVWARLAEQTSFVANWLSTPRKEKWITRFWETCLSEPYVDSRLDMVFGESGSTLGHLARTSEIAQRLLDAGFKRHNHRDASGRHCLFPAVKSLNSPLVSLLLAAGTLVDIKDKKGRTCLHKLLRGGVGRITNPQLHEGAAVFAIVRLLLDFASMQPLASITDDCLCPCSENGHLASGQLSAEFRDQSMIEATSPLWVAEYVCRLEDAGRVEEARKSLLGQLRLDQEEDRPWDAIEGEKKVGSLDAEMEEFRRLPLDSLKAQLALRMRESYDTLNATRATKAEEEKEQRRTRRAKQGGFQQPLHTTPLPKVEVDKANDRILTSIDLLFQNQELLHDIARGAFGDCRADPLRILYKYLDYVVLYMMDEIQANSDRKDEFIGRRLKWIIIILAAMDLPEYSEFYKGWERDWSERRTPE